MKRYQPLGPGSTLHSKRNHPVVQVSREDAMAFTIWTGKRLPTEDEWEAASRSVNGYDFPWGQDFKDGLCNTEEAFIGDTTPVDKYKDSANIFGIIDTMGNVLEWTLDKFDPLVNEKPGFENYVIKGGSWISDNIALIQPLFVRP
ncbi:formylglycine-generating enzyme family protein [Thermodesulfobacteriota bacterium]